MAVVAFGAVAVAAALLPGMLDHDRLQPGVATASGVLAALMFVSLLGMGIDRRPEGGYFGFIERAFYGCMTAWLIVVAVLLAMQ